MGYLGVDHFGIKGHQNQKLLTLTKLDLTRAGRPLHEQHDLRKYAVP
jgi:hypothetical protein